MLPGMGLSVCVCSLIHLPPQVKEVQAEKEKEAEQFQTSYQVQCTNTPLILTHSPSLPHKHTQQKVQELQKAMETICYLQEQLEATPTLAEATPPLSGSVDDLRRSEEAPRRREREMEVRAVFGQINTPHSPHTHTHTAGEGGKDYQPSEPALCSN